jgi:hypothetical protein
VNDVGSGGNVDTVVVVVGVSVDDETPLLCIVVAVNVVEVFVVDTVFVVVVVFAFVVLVVDIVAVFLDVADVVVVVLDALDVAVVRDRGVDVDVFDGVGDGLIVVVGAQVELHTQRAPQYDAIVMLKQLRSVGSSVTDRVKK